MLGEQRTPPVDVPTNLLLDRVSIKTLSIGAFVHDNRLEKFVASRLTRSELREQGFELTTGGVSSRARMPVFSYLSEAEAAAAYSYLMAYPPK